MASDITNKNIPSYVSKEFFKKVLENELTKKNIQIENYTISLIGGGGENYTSNMYCVSIKYNNAEDSKIREIDLIIKAIRAFGNSNQKVLEDFNVFKIEKNIYLEMIPEIERKLGSNVTMAPKCYYASESDCVLILRNFKTLGYRLGDRLTGLDEAHCSAVLKKIGQFHAASMVIAKENPELVKRFDKGLFNEYVKDSEIFKDIFLTHFNHMIGVVEKWSDYETITLKLKKMSSNIIERGIDIFKPRKGQLMVLNHGDLWVNNILFKYDTNNTPSDVAFVDFQLSVYGSPGIDINYFLNLSTSLDVLKMRRYELLKVYYHSLKSTLEKLEYSPIPHWDDVRKEVRAKELYGLITLATLLPIMSMDRNASQDNSLESFGDNDEAKRKRDIMFSSERMLATMKYALNRFDELGVLDS